MRAALFLFLMLLAGISKATNYYVDPSSTASIQNGTLDGPWKTLSQVQAKMNSFNPGDFIYFKKGQTFTGSLDIKRSGTATAPITFSSYGSATEMPVFTSTGATGVLISYVQYVVIDGIKITDPTMDPNDHGLEANLNLAFYVDGSSYVTIKNCDISLVGGGVSIQGNNNTIDHNTIQNLRMINNTPGGDDDYGAIPIVIDGSNNNIVNNLFKDGWADSYDYTYDGGAIEIYGAANNNNKIMYNTAVNCDGFMEIGYSNGGETNDNLVAYNKLVNCGEIVYISTSGNFATTVHNLQIYNNVIVNTVIQLTRPSTMVGISSSTSGTNIVSLKNNIFWLTTGIDVAFPGRWATGQLIHEDNIYHLGTGSVLNYTISASELSTTSALFTNTVATDPLAWNYMPVTNSPAIDFGQNLGLQKDFAGNPVPAIPNAGILESAASAPSALAATSSAGAINCNGGTTTVTVSATGGITPYSGTGSFTVNAGTYTYTITDAAGTVRTTSVTITQPTVIVSTASAGTIGVFGGTTTVTVGATGGTSPYTYSINSGIFQSGNVFLNVLAGTQVVTVKDSKGCTAVKTLSINQPGQMAATATQGAVIACRGGSTTVTTAATGGVAPYTGTGTFTVMAGTYTYIVKDAAGTTKSLTVTVTEPTVLNATIVAPGVYSSTAKTTATITATGGSPSYTYSLDAGNYQTANIFSNVAMGSHAIKVKDARGCINSFNFSVVLLPANPLAVSAVTGYITCFGGSSTVTISATGGIAPYTGTGVFSVTAGTRTYTVRDAAGTSIIKTVTVVQPKQIIATISNGTIVSYGGSTSANISATGGTGAYTYKLNNGAYQSSNTFNNLIAGNYSVTIKDARNCTGVQTFTLVQPAQGAFKLLLVSKTNETCRNKKNGTIQVSGSAGTMGYVYKLGNGSYSAGNSFINLAPGSYTVTGKDATGTSSSVTVTIASSQVSCPAAREEIAQTVEVVNKNINAEKIKTVTPEVIAGLKITAFPNPTTSQFSLIVENGNAENIHIIVMNINGQKMYEATSNVNQKNTFGNNFNAGIYFAKIIQGNKEQVIKLIKTK